jgi:ADP-ribosylglycohydrolase
MRVAPVGLMSWRHGHSPQRAFDLAADLAGLTHGHATGVLASGALAVLVHGVVGGSPLTAALDAAKACLREKNAHQETLHALERAEELAAANAPPEEAIPALGRGWVAEEALGISVYCALVAQNLERGLIMAVNHDGDSDSTGAITGNLLGAMHGVEAIPQHWLERLELRNVISEIAEDLHAFADWPIGDSSPDTDASRRILEKYPGW